MIPRIIHCFWAKGPKTKLAERCLASWRRFAPGWEIREWSLADIQRMASLPIFCQKAIRHRKWAFVADWARFEILRAEGGVYLDADVELVESVSLLPEGEWVAQEFVPGGVAANPGSGIALEKDSDVARMMIIHYAGAAYNPDVTVGETLERLLKTKGLALARLGPEVMSPIGLDGKLRRTGRTVGIHWYAMSWASPQRKLAKWLSWHGMRWVVNGLLRVKRMFVR